MLIVAATAAEIDPLLAALKQRSDCGDRLRACARGNHDIEVLTTGVGMVATAVWSSRVLATREYNVALNLGVCGSFDPAIPAGAVVHVVSEELPEMGAETDDRFLTLHDLKLLGQDDFPFRDGRLMNVEPPDIDALRGLPQVRGITINTVHGNERSIEAVRQRCDPQVETMEGAAFMYACLVRGIPFAEVRAVSNVVEKRNRAAWRLGEAIDNLSTAALRIIDQA
jgi:futalosine hydrolase